MNDIKLPLAEALAVLHTATTPQGILALAEEAENYRRIWARDAVIAGLAGLLSGDDTLIEGLKQSLQTLGDRPLPTGALPSNVSLDGQSVSYGSLAGRVDATTWWLIGAGIYVKKTGDQPFLKKYTGNVQKAMAVLDAWEFNGRHLVYTPLSGNWADEYPLHGYLLYDNLLRLWALKLWAGIMASAEWEIKENKVREIIQKNFWPQEKAGDLYHPKLRHQPDQKFWSTGFHPGGKYEMFDAAGNALALITGITTPAQGQLLANYIQQIYIQLGRPFIPAFWPVIYPGDALWPALESNYAYHFKNEPHHFHNGGIWPVMMGLMSMGLALNGYSDISKSIALGYAGEALNASWPFAEYLNSKDFSPGGKKNLCFSAAGCIFISHSVQQDFIQKFDFI
ncbi:MAG: hypothetical protein IPN29_18385 [Saprospiraceae bacterium]|nr:hypothetical protein [Saprospiraceae bacterium]